MQELRALGKSGMRVTPIGLGTWQFSGGKGLAGRYWGRLPQEEVNRIIAAALDGGINWFDTAEMYGRGHAEEALARALQAAGRKSEDVVLADKWWPFPRTAGNIRRTFDDRLRHLQGFAVDLYQVHQPFSLSTVPSQMKAMAELLRAGRIRGVGVSNFSARDMRRAHATLAARGIPLASNQVQYSLLSRRIERNGVLETAQELGVTIIAYSPLAQGLLSGKFHEDPGRIRKSKGVRRFLPAFRSKGLEASRPVVQELRAIAEAHGVTPTQVALNWLINARGEGVVAIPGASKVEHVEQNVGAMGWRLKDSEIQRLDSVSRPFV